MDPAHLIRRVRERSGLTLRGLARRAETSHATLSAYENGSKVPRTDTLQRILRAAGYEPEVSLVRRPDEWRMREAKGRELEAVLDLAGHFPVSRDLTPLPAAFGKRVDRVAR